MIRAIISKEWHQHRSRYLFYWIAVHAPMLILCLVIAFSTGARTPFADLSDALTMKYLPLSLIETLLVTTIFLLLTAYLAVATFGPEVDDRSLFFFYEQPVSRKLYLSTKLAYGACHVVLANSSAILLMPVAVYMMMLISGKVTSAGSAAAFGLVMAAAGRAAIWCTLISLAGFSLSALLSALVPRWWLAAICAIVLMLVLIPNVAEYVNYLPDIAGDSMSIGMNVSTNNTQWITISRPVTNAELAAFAPWRVGPLFSLILLSAACAASTAFLYSRKQL